MSTFMYVSTSVCGRMRNSSRSWYTLNTLQISFKHVTITLEYVGIRCQEIPKFCVCIKKIFSVCRRIAYTYVRHKLDLRNRYAMHRLRYVSTNVCGRMGDSASMLVYAE